MSVTYRIRGRRWLRKYTAPGLSPSTAAGSDVAAIADRLCDVPWTPADPGAMPCFPTYAGTQVNENAAARDCFDAAEWCAEHDEAKRHRVYANAVVYRFALPDSARALTLEKVSVAVTCDPYTPQGARVAARVTDEDDIPTACAEIRTLDAHEAAVAGRTVVTNEETGAVTWYETTRQIDLPIGAPARKWLLVFVGLEEFRARNGWLEGAAKAGDITATFSGAVDGWSEDAPVDCGPSADVPFQLVRRGVLPSTAGGCVSALQVQLNGDALADGKLQTECAEEASVIGLSALYAGFWGKKMVAVPASLAGTTRPGASWCVRNWRVGKDGSPVWQLAATALVVPFAAPVVHRAAKIRLEWSGLRCSVGARLSVWLKRGAYVEAPELSDPNLYASDAAEGWDYVGSFGASEAGSVDLALASQIDDPVATLLVTAFEPIDAIDFGLFFPQGVGNVDIDLASQTIEGLDTAFMPDITLLCYR